MALCMTKSVGVKFTSVNELIGLSDPLSTVPTKY